MKGEAPEKPAESAPAEPTKPCRVCAYPIPAAALKCTRCDSLQNWLGKIHLSTTTLSLLIALIATSVSAIPVITNLLQTNDSRIYVRFWGAGENKLVLVAVNSGNRPGFVARGFLELGSGRNVMLIPDGPKLRLVKPGEVELIRFDIPDVYRNRPNPLKPSDFEGTCTLTTQVINFRSDKSSSVSSFNCIDLTTSELILQGEVLSEGLRTLQELRSAPAKVADTANSLAGE